MTYEEKVNKLIQAGIEIMSLRHWEIQFRVLHRGFMPSESDGYTVLNHSYLTASIDICEGLDDRRLTHVVLHEMVHVLLSPVDMAKSYMLAHIGGKLNLREEQQADQAQEMVCQLLARGLYSLEAIVDLLKEQEDG